MALRLGQYFKMEPQFWLNLQNNYDLGVAEGGVWAKIRKLIPEFVPTRSFRRTVIQSEGHRGWLWRQG